MKIIYFILGFCTAVLAGYLYESTQYYQTPEITLNSASALTAATTAKLILRTKCSPFPRCNTSIYGYEDSNWKKGLKVIK